MLVDPVVSGAVPGSESAVPMRWRSDRRGSYDELREFIIDAVANDAPPSPDLIIANRQLAWWEAKHRIGDVKSFPVSLFISITDVCNARCSFCSYSPETASGRIVRADDIQRIASWLKFVEYFRPNSALGDPLTHPQIGEILQAVRRQAPFINVGLTTNGALLNRTLQTIVSGYVRLIIISLNAARRETYERDMAPLKWDTILANIHALQELKAKTGADLPVLQAAYVLHKHNLEEVVELPRLLHSLGIRQLRIAAMTSPRPIKSRTLYNAHDSIYFVRDRAKSILATLRTECMRHDVQLVMPLPKL